MKTPQGLSFYFDFFFFPFAERGGTNCRALSHTLHPATPTWRPVHFNATIHRDCKIIAVYVKIKGLLGPWMFFAAVLQVATWKNQHITVLPVQYPEKKKNP